MVERRSGREWLWLLANPGKSQLMKIGVCTFSFRSLCRPEAAASLGLPCPATFDGLIDLAVRYGLGVAEAPLSPETPLAEAARLKERAEAAGIRLVLAGGRVATSPLEAR